MENKVNEGLVTLSIQNVVLLGLEITEQGRALSEQPKYESYEFRFEIVPHIDLVKEEVHMGLKVLVLDITSKVAYGIFSTLTTFKAIGLKKISTPMDGIAHTDTGMLRLMAGLCVSTNRGMLIMSVANTKINNALIPIVNPNIFFTEPLHQLSPSEMIKTIETPR